MFRNVCAFQVSNVCQTWNNLLFSLNHYNTDLENIAMHDVRNSFIRWNMYCTSEISLLSSNRVCSDSSIFQLKIYLCQPISSCDVKHVMYTRTRMAHNNPQFFSLYIYSDVNAYKIIQTKKYHQTLSHLYT